MLPLVGDFLPLDASRRAAVVIAARGRDDEIAKASRAAVAPGISVAHGIQPQSLLPPHARVSS
jgi:hypothetical protein